ncbi:MAG: protein kinase, partial [Planctomycetota bacterium]
GKIWVANFGVAKADEDKSDRSRIISDNAKSKFVALDQMRSTGDARSDVQSLGMTLYEMASGKQAWASLNTSQLLKVRAGTEPLDLTEQSPFVPKPLAEIIMKACSSRPEDRYQSAREFEVVLSRFAQGEKVPDRRRRPRHKSTKFDRRWIVASTAFGVPAAVYLLIGLYSLLWKATEDVASTELPVTRVVLNTGDDKAAAQRPNEKTNRETSIVSRIQPGADEASDRVTQLMNKVIDAQRQSGDGETSDRITDLMNQVIDAQRQSGDRETSDRITELMNQVIDAQRQSGDGETSDRITELMEAMIKKSEVTSKTPKTAANDLGKTNNGDGFTYDEMDHPLTNAVRNLDLSRQVSSLRLSTADKLSSQAKIAALGEAIRRTLINEKQIHDLLSYLPPEAQTRKINEEISDPMLISFLLALHRTFEIARSNLADSQQFMQHEKLKEALRPVDNLKKARHRTSE